MLAALVAGAGGLTHYSYEDNHRCRPSLDLGDTFRRSQSAVQ